MLKKKVESKVKEVSNEQPVKLVEFNTALQIKNIIADFEEKGLNESLSKLINKSVTNRPSSQKVIDIPKQIGNLRHITSISNRNLKENEEVNIASIVFDEGDKSAIKIPTLVYRDSFRGNSEIKDLQEFEVALSNINSIIETDSKANGQEKPVEKVFNLSDEEYIIENEFQEGENNFENQSIISSNVLTHIYHPKIVSTLFTEKSMISNAQDSINQDSYFLSGSVFGDNVDS